MIIDITNEIFTSLKTLLTGVTVLPAYPSTAPEFPCVVVLEHYNQTKSDCVDTSGETVNDVSLEINIFTIGDTKMSDAKTFRNSVDNLLAGTYRMARVFSQEVPNYLDTNVYRYMLRYEFSVDINRTIYKR